MSITRFTWVLGGACLGAMLAGAGCREDITPPPDGAVPDGPFDQGDGGGPDALPARGTVKVVARPNLRTSEKGGQAGFLVSLDSTPAVNVVLALSSSDPTEGTVSPRMLTFTPTNWNAPQTVTITGVDDGTKDGNASYTIVIAAAVSADPRWGGVDTPDVAVTNLDDETAGILVTAADNLRTFENGGTATFTVVLQHRPTANVSIPLRSSDPGEGVPGAASVIFTSVNWDAPQTVTVMGVDDADADGPQSYLIRLEPAVSADSAYQGLDGDDVNLVNVDEDSPGITVEAPVLLTTSEGGGNATFTVVLNSRPAAEVVINLASSDISEGLVTPGRLVFTTFNWDAPQVVTVTGVDDDVADGAQPYTISATSVTSSDSGYAGQAVAAVKAANTDDDTPGVVVTPAMISVSEAGTEATFTVVLASAPRANVVVPVSSGDISEGTVAPTSLTFTTVNWRSPQTVTVTGVGDNLADGNQMFSVLLAPTESTDPAYVGLDPLNVAAVNVDDDSAGVTITPVSGLTTTEAGGQATFTVVLNSQPEADVSIALSSNDTSEGTVTATPLVFTAVNWAAPQTVTVTGVDDDVADGNQTFAVVTAAAVSTDSGYAGINPPDVALSNTDNDSPGFTVTPVSGLTTDENGQQATFTIALNSQPTGDVTVGLTSSDTSEGAVLPTSVTFTTTNWSAAQTVTVTGVDDDLADGSPSFNIVTAPATGSDTSGYVGLNPPNVAVTNTDDDTAGITVSAISGPVSEAGGTATFTVRLNSQPEANVVIALSSSDTSEGTVAPAALTFTPVNWGSAQTVTVTGINDDLDDGGQVFTIVTAAATAPGDSTGYNGRDAANVMVTNTDNDTAGITVSAISGPTTEAGGTATFTVVLNSQPEANVVIGLSSSDTSEGTVAPASLTFTMVNWASPQMVTVNGVNDDLDDGSPMYTIVTAAATAPGDSTGYNGMDAANVTVTNTDNDTAGITVSAISGPTTEAGGTATFTVVLNSQPEANVVIGLSSSDTGEGTVAPASLTFTASNWATAQTVTVTGVNDDLDDGSPMYTIVTAAATAPGDSTGYNGMDAANVTVTNTDNDTAGITVSAISGPTTEAGGTATFTVALNSQPEATVTIGLSSSDTGEGTVAPASLTFTTANWATAQTVTVTGVNDDLDDGSPMYTIVTAAAVAVGDSTGYNGMDAANVTVTNTDNDTAGITVSAISGPTTEAGGTATFTVGLNSQPEANVTIGLTSSDTTEGTVLPAMLTFTTGNWATAQMVTVTGVDDQFADGSPTYTIVTAPASAPGDSTGYNGMDAANVTVTNTDDDMAGISVSAISGPTTEAGGTATFTVELTSRPEATVTIDLSSSNTMEGTVSPMTLAFTTGDWNMAQTVTVTGVNDFVVDPGAAYTIVTAAAMAMGDSTGYHGMNAADVMVTNTDNDAAGFTISAISGHTTEAMGTATFTVRLTAQPSASVVIGLTSNDTTEGTVAPAMLTFTTSDWNMNQTVTVTGVDDLVVDGNISYSIVTAEDTTTADLDYRNLNPADVTVINDDDD